jgi:hypothetical protein
MFPIVIALGCASNAASPSAQLGAQAPDFTLKGLDGAAWTLSEHANETVVLEWFNPGCPFVVYAHGDADAPLGSMAKDTTGVTWVAINSSASGKQGHGVEANKKAAAEWKMSHPILLDEDGQVGKLYGAVTTPHMYVIHDGNLVYRGALDNKPLGKGDGARANHVAAALADIGAGKPVTRAETKPYGCSVKY